MEEKKQTATLAPRMLGFVISEELKEVVINYLRTRPYQEVEILIDELKKLPMLKTTKPEEPETPEKS